MKVSDIGHLTIRKGLQLRFCKNKNDIGKRVECEDQYDMCYTATITCQYHEWFAKHQNISQNETIYLRGCGRPAVYGGN